MSILDGKAVSWSVVGIHTSTMAKSVVDADEMDPARRVIPSGWLEIPVCPEIGRL